MAQRECPECGHDLDHRLRHYHGCAVAEAEHAALLAVERAAREYREAELAYARAKTAECMNERILVVQEKRAALDAALAGLEGYR